MKKTLFESSFKTLACGFWLSANLLFAADNPLIISSQGPAWEAPKSAADRAAQQRFLTEAYALEQAQQQNRTIRQQSEVLKIYSKDPWRKINGLTNYVASEGWVQFQGKVQSIETDGILFQGGFGEVLTINTGIDTSTDIITQDGVTSQSQNRSAQKKTTQSVTTTRKNYEKVYGDDFFMVVHFPYPVQPGRGYERLMAFDAGYITYTTRNNEVLTVRKLDYGTPCIKTWSTEEIEAAYKQAASERAKIEEQKRAQRELETAQAEANKANLELERRQRLEELEADKKAKLEAIEADKKAKIDKIVTHYRQQADKGDVIALRRMGEFYRDGYGFPKDDLKSAEYFKKADDMAEADAQRQAQTERLQNEAALKQRFNNSLVRAKQGYIESMIAVGKCYRDGIGVEKDIKSAREYFKKASDLASLEAANLLVELDK